MHLLFALLFAVASHAEDAIEIHQETPVYKAAEPGAHVFFYLHKGEKVREAATEHPDFLRIRVKRGGKSYVGFVQKVDVQGDAAEDHKAGGTEWAFGGGYEYISLTQKGKSFQDNDQVTYTISEFKSVAYAPFFSVQMNRDDYWRLTLAQKKTHYAATAVKDLVGSTSKTVDLQQTFYSALLQKAWMPFTIKNVYFGLGAEVAKATAVNLVLGGIELPTSSDQLPIYFGGMIFAGGTWSFNRTLSIYGEGRVQYIANQSPGILDLEAAVGLLYWP